MPKIRHLALVCMDPEKLATFYCEVFDMKVVGRSNRNGRGNVVCALPRRCRKPAELPHFRAGSKTALTNVLRRPYRRTARRGRPDHGHRLHLIWFGRRRAWLQLLAAWKNAKARFEP